MVIKKKTPGKQKSFDIFIIKIQESKLRKIKITENSIKETTVAFLKKLIGVFWDSESW